MSLFYRFASKFCYVFLKLFYNAQAEGLENLPKEACLITSNHVSFLDPPMVGAFIREPIYFLARKTLFKPPIMDKLLPMVNTIPVDQEKPDMVGLKKIIHFLRSGEKVVIFPEGKRSPNGEIQPAMPGVGFVVAKSQAPVLPVRIFGAFDAWPIHGKLKFFLPMRIVFGKPIHFTFSERPSKEEYEKVGQDIMRAIGELKDPRLVKNS